MNSRATPESLFHDARAILDPREREAFLERGCAGDARLRKRVEALLRADSKAAGFLESRALDREHAPNVLGLEQQGEHIERYQLIELIGEGGFGSVWRAEQSHPVKRRVALKILKLGLDTKAVVARFEAERQALALMDHPSIARVFDGGATPTGRPYFAMEFVQGVPITTFCDEAQLPLRARLELFADVCVALQHAHHKGVIHRDVKPSNVLVTLEDGRPRPKVIDFGIAKATGVELSERTLLTGLHQMIGTPDYMAPEQAAGSLDIDTRADVYSLGVLLYELLTGSKPLDLRAATGAGLAELLRVIREVDPERPSTRTSTSDDDSRQAASRRALAPRELSSHLRGDLDWIVLKALEKDRARRYATAAALADDVGRFLRDEPVLATPPSASYVFAKYVRRHKGAVAAAAAILVVLLGGVAASMRFAFRAEQRRIESELARGEADRARANAESAAERAERAEREARDRAAELEQVVGFQEHQFDAIDAESVGLRIRRSLLEQRRAELERSRPDAARATASLAELEAQLDSANMTSVAVDALDDSIFVPTRTAIDTRFAAQPVVRASLLERLAQSLAGLGRFEREAEIRAEVAQLREGALGPEHELTLAARLALLGLASEAPDRAARSSELESFAAQARQLLGVDHELELEALGALGTLASHGGDHARAEELFRRALEGWRRRELADDPRALDARSNLGAELISLQRTDEGVAELEGALAGFDRVFGPRNRRALATLHSLCTAWMTLGRQSEALAELREALAFARQAYGDDHTITLGLMDNLAGNLHNVGLVDEAEPLFVELVERLRHVPGSGDVELHHALARLGRLRSAQQRYEEAIALLSEAYAGLVELLPREHAALAACAHNLGTALYNLRRPREALVYLQHAYEARRATLGLDSVETATTAQALASALFGLQRADEAFEIYRPAVESLESSWGADHERVVRAWRNLGVIAQARRDFESAAAAFRRSSDALRRQGQTSGAEMHSDLGFLASSLLELERWPEAEAVIAECAELRERLLPTDSWAQAHSRALLGTLRLRQERLDEALELLPPAAEVLLAAPELAALRPGQSDRAAEAAERAAAVFDALQRRSPSPEHASQAALWHGLAASRRAAAGRAP
ncbi:MAG: serine/threonine protein kinase [Planctomycetes bacterium]|nr:serine/threonine protein kinase [Planctomycetota bacterium]